MSDKVKFYKNRDRDKKEARQAYMPQYQLMGIEPAEIATPSAYPGAHIAKVIPAEVDNPRTRQIGLRQPYTAPATPDRLVPNIGNNMDHTWSGVNGDIIDDMSDLDPNHPMIDNNEYVSTDDLKTSSNNTSADMFSTLSGLSEGDYLLIIDGVPLCSGPMDAIQAQARSLVFDEEIPVESLLIVKRVNVKVGIFLD